MDQEDLVIVGGGISGLYAAYSILKNSKKKMKITLIEKTGELGGRVHSYYGKHPITKESFSYECGAGRIGKNHVLTMDLIKKAKLQKLLYPIANKYYYFLDNKMYKSQLSYLKEKGYSERFKTISDIWKFVIFKFSKASPLMLEYLRHVNTITGLKKLIKDDGLVDILVETFGYISEMITMNAYDALQTIKNDFDVENSRFYVLGNGLGQIVKYLEEGIEDKVKIMKRTTLMDIVKTKDGYELELMDESSSSQFLTTKNIFLAIEKPGLMRIPYLNSIRKTLNAVKEEPLLRIYAIYPEKDGKIWFDGIPKVITDTPLQYIIPINAKSGLIMISYTDNYYTSFWQTALVEGKTREYLRKYLGEIFPGKEIPDPILLNHHYWVNGAHYFLPGYNSDNVRKELEEYGKETGIWIIGETYSRRQAWIEGALETALDAVKWLIGMNGGKKEIKISRSELEKHNKVDDGWLAYNGKVYDVSEWIPRHPGGMVITSGLGKDATELFNSIPKHSPSFFIENAPYVKLIGKLED